MGYNVFYLANLARHIQKGIWAMPICTVNPKNASAEDIVVANASDLQQRFRDKIVEVWGVHPLDVIVRGESAKTIFPDENSADVDIWVETNPSSRLGPLADQLRNELRSLWYEIVGRGYLIEVWVRFVDGSWLAANEEGAVLDQEDIHLT